MEVEYSRRCKLHSLHLFLIIHLCVANSTNAKPLDFLINNHVTCYRVLHVTSVNQRRVLRRPNVLLLVKYPREARIRETRLPRDATSFLGRRPSRDFSSRTQRTHSRTCSSQEIGRRYWRFLYADSQDRKINKEVWNLHLHWCSFFSSATLSYKIRNYSLSIFSFCRASFFLLSFFFDGSSSVAFATTSSFSVKITSMWQGELMYAVKNHKSRWPSVARAK